jgi:hypothetical protein
MPVLNADHYSLVEIAAREMHAISRQSAHFPHGNNSDDHSNAILACMSGNLDSLRIMLRYWQSPQWKY